MKKKVFSIAASLMLVLFMSVGWHASAQPCHSKIIQAPAGSTGMGDEIVVLSSDGCTPAGWTGPWETLNFNGLSDLEMSEWTIWGLGCNLMHAHTMLRFDMSPANLPTNAVITYAELRLNGIPSSLQNTLGNTLYPGSSAPFFDNLGQVYMIDATAPPWSKTTVTWNTAPGWAPGTPTMPIRGSVSQWNDNFAIDVTPITQQIWATMNLPGHTNNGYLLKLNAFNYYRNTMWASSSNRFVLPAPALYVEYTTCDATFTYGNINPNTFTFTANDPASCYNYVWDYGDGSSYGSGSSTSHYYSAPGTYTVCLMMKDAGGTIMCQYCTTITVPPPVPRPAGSTSVPNLTMDGPISIVSVSPNPAHDNMNVTLVLMQDAALHYNVYDMQGKLVLQGDNNLSKGSQKISVNVQRLAPGTYLLELQDGHSTATTKFTKE